MKKIGISEKYIDELKRETAKEIYDGLDSVDIYHEIGRARIWSLSNDCVVDEVVDYIKEKIKKRYFGDEK